MRVENQGRDAFDICFFQLPRELTLDAFNRQRGGKLAHKATGVRKPSLYRQNAASLDIFTVGGVCEHFGNDPPAIVERIIRLEKGTDINMIRNPVKLREVKRPQGNELIFRFRDQQTYGHTRVDIVMDLRNQDHFFMRC